MLTLKNRNNKDFGKFCKYSKKFHLQPQSTNNGIFSRFVNEIRVFLQYLFMNYNNRYIETENPKNEHIIKGFPFFTLFHLQNAIINSISVYYTVNEKFFRIYKNRVKELNINNILCKWKHKNSFTIIYN